MSPRRTAIISLVAVVLSAAAYANSLPNGFHFDDGHSIQDNAWLRDLRHIPRYFWDVTTFSPLAENRSYRPILLTGFALSHALGGGAPWAYRLFSIAIHALAAAVVGLLTARLWPAARGESARAASEDGPFWAGLTASVVMAVHPLATEAVNYASARSSLQAAALMFVCLWLYVRARQERHWPSLAGSTVALLLAMATKIIAVTAPALALAWTVTLGPERRERRYLRWFGSLVPLAVAAFGFTMLHEWLVGSETRAARSAIAPTSFFLTQIRVWAHYQGLFAWPADLCADLTMPWSQSIYEPRVLAGLAWTAVLVGTALWALRRRPLYSFGVFWYYVTLSPTNSFVPLSEPASEHRVYIALPGLIWAVIGGLGPSVETVVMRRKSWRRPLALAGVVVAGVLLVATWLRNPVWRNGESLWGDVLTCAPDNGRAHLNYGRALMSKGDYEGAAKSFEQCRILLPRWIFCRINSAVLALAQGQIVEADRYMTTARRLRPRNVYTLYWSGRVSMTKARYEAAERYYRQTLQVAPGFADAERGLAMAVFRAGRLAEADPLFASLAAERQLDADGWHAWGLVAERAGDLETARERYEVALSLYPKHAGARERLDRLK